MKKPTITGQIYESIFELLESHPEGINWTNLNKMIEKKHAIFTMGFAIDEHAKEKKIERF